MPSLPAQQSSRIQCPKKSFTSSNSRTRLVMTISCQDSSTRPKAQKGWHQEQGKARQGFIFLGSVVSRGPSRNGSGCRPSSISALAYVQQFPVRAKGGAGVVICGRFTFCFGGVPPFPCKVREPSTQAHVPKTRPFPGWLCRGGTFHQGGATNTALCTLTLTPLTVATTTTLQVPEAPAPQASALLTTCTPPERTRGQTETLTGNWEPRLPSQPVSCHNGHSNTLQTEQTALTTATAACAPAMEL